MAAFPQEQNVAMHRRALPSHLSIRITWELFKKNSNLGPHPEPIKAKSLASLSFKSCHMIAKCRQVWALMLEACLPGQAWFLGLFLSKRHHPPSGRCFWNSEDHAGMDWSKKTWRSTLWLTPAFQHFYRCTSKWPHLCTSEFLRFPRMGSPCHQELSPYLKPTLSKEATMSHPNCHSLVYFLSFQRGANESLVSASLRDNVDAHLFPWHQRPPFCLMCSWRRL